MIEKNIINKTDYDSDLYKVIFKFDEDQQFDNVFCILKCSYGNIAIAYYDNNVPVNYYLHNEILFLSYGKTCTVLDLKKRIPLYYDTGAFSLIYDIVSIPSKEKVLMIGEISIKCFSSDGKLIFNMSCKEIIADWKISENDVEITYYDGSNELIKI